MLLVFWSEFIIVGECFLSALMYIIVVLYQGDDYTEMVSVLYSFSYNCWISDKEYNAHEHVWVLTVAIKIRITKYIGVFDGNW
jgi:hypothetical protein